MIYGYARISSKSQEDGNGLEVQRRELSEAGAERVFEDVFTGTTMHRPQWDELDSLLADGDTLVVAKLDRIARTASEGCAAVRELVERGVTVNVLNMGVVSDTPVGRMVLTVMFAMAEFERDLIVERLSAGKAVARQREGYREGRPRAALDEGLFEELCEKVDSGELSKCSAARQLGVSERTFRRRKGERDAA